MSGLKLRIGADDFGALATALEVAEKVVFLYATFADRTFDVRGIEVMRGDDFASQSGRHVELADDVRPRVIKTAWDTDRSLIEAHSHGDRGYARFSPTDLCGFEEWVPHVLWRLRGRPYVALVKAGETWDALAWLDGDPPYAIEAIEVVRGNSVVETIIPTNATLAKLAAADEED